MPSPTSFDSAEIDPCCFDRYRSSQWTGRARHWSGSQPPSDQFVILPPFLYQDRMLSRLCAGVRDDGRRITHCYFCRLDRTGLHKGQPGIHWENRLFLEAIIWRVGVDADEICSRFTQSARSWDITLSPDEPVECDATPLFPKCSPQANMRKDRVLALSCV